MSYTNGLDDPTQFFNTILYTGNGSNRTITGVGFQPDWVWVKNRTVARPHRLADSVRGDAKIIVSNDVIAEYTDTTQISGFDSDGFDVGTGTAVNESSKSFVSWNWLAGGTASSNTDGSITSTVSANTTSGFSVVKWTGDNSSTATIGHSLGAIPNIVIVKRIDAVDNWYVYSKPVGNTSVLNLDTTSATAASINYWNNTDPTTTVFTVGDSFRTTGSFIAYCFAEKKGYSKFGSYTGNGNADGTFVYTGFKPSFVMIKGTTSSEHWLMYDNKRKVFNTNDEVIYANLSNAEDTNSGLQIDLLSNGFKLRGASANLNNSGQTFIFMAFAEAPFVNSNGIPNNAR